VKNDILILGLTAALFACGGKEQTTAPLAQAKPAGQTSVPAVAQQLPPGHPPIDMMKQQAAPATPASAGAVTGRILETMNAGGYTYMRLGTPTGDVWTAVRETKVQKGATVTVETQMVAEKFQSGSLHRTFDKLIMGVLADERAKEAPAKEVTANPMSTAMQHMNSAVNVGDVTVEKAEGGRNVAETWAKRNELKDKPVVIRGKVVKFLGGIMGRNWIHLRDGSGSRAAGNDDITVTTEQVARVGDVVTVSGTVRVDKDFGAGYQYAVIVEDAKLQK
jgi:hypothetical protein